MIILKIAIAACLVVFLAALIYSLVEQVRSIRAKIAQDIKRAMEEEPGATEETFGEDGLYMDAPHMDAPPPKKGLRVTKSSEGGKDG